MSATEIQKTHWRNKLMTKDEFYSKQELSMLLNAVKGNERSKGYFKGYRFKPLVYPILIITSQINRREYQF